MTAAIVTTSNANTGAIAEYNQAVAAAGAVANDYAAAASGCGRVEFFGHAEPLR